MIFSFRRMVKPEHLNAANTLFGGTLVAWIDEASAMYAMEQMQVKRLVTLKISEMLFKKPAKQGDILEFNCYKKKVGRTSFTLVCRVMTKAILPKEEPVEIAQCEIVFVALDEKGKPTHFYPIGDEVNVNAYWYQDQKPEKDCMHQVLLSRVGPTPVSVVKTISKILDISIADASKYIDKCRTDGECTVLREVSYTEAKAAEEQLGLTGAYVHLFCIEEYSEPKLACAMAAAVYQHKIIESSTK